MCWSKTGENVHIFALAYKGKFLYLSDRSDAFKRSGLYNAFIIFKAQYQLFYWVAET